jgi:hypothetical protein
VEDAVEWGWWWQAVAIVVVVVVAVLDQLTGQPIL